MIFLKLFAAFIIFFPKNIMKNLEKADIKIVFNPQLEIKKRKDAISIKAKEIEYPKKQSYLRYKYDPACEKLKTNN
jgi:hypothetical protein